jgi:hypothetical protein
MCFFLAGYQLSTLDDRADTVGVLVMASTAPSSMAEVPLEIMPQLPLFYESPHPVS